MKKLVFYWCVCLQCQPWQWQITKTDSGRTVAYEGADFHHYLL